MAIPMVAIVGRPNVGKSSLFNALAGKRIAIVDPTAGVTRDRVSTLLKVGDRYIELVNTGGMGIQNVDNLTALVEHQITLAIDRAEIIIFVVDGRAGLAPLDEQVAQRLHTVDKPVFCVVNKCDSPEWDANAADFYRLGWSKIYCVSAQQRRNRDLLLELIARNLPTDADREISAVALKLAIVGQRNTGKSTFINSLAECERMIVSEVPGTTRDSVDVRFESDGKSFIAIDTAGVRRKKSIQTDIEFYSLARAERSIRRADVVLLFLDPTHRVSKVDKKLAEYILEQHKPAIFVVNKWDLMLPMPTGQYGDYLRKVFPSLDYVPIAFVTALRGKNVHVVLNLAQSIFKQAQARAGTGDLNRVLRDAIEAQTPPLRQNRRPKINFATQVATQPPTIVLFTNGPHLVDNTYQRYLLKAFRDHLPFKDVPIKLFLRHKNRESLETSDKGSAEAPSSGKRVRRPKKTFVTKSKKAKSKSQPELWSDV